jgi:hypothetical protein
MQSKDPETFWNKHFQSDASRSQNFCNLVCNDLCDKWDALGFSGPSKAVSAPGWCDNRIDRSSHIKCCPCEVDMETVFHEEIKTKDEDGKLVFPDLSVCRSVGPGGLLEVGPDHTLTEEEKMGVK